MTVCIPRLVDILCNTGLLSAYARNQSRRAVVRRSRIKVYYTKESENGADRRVESVSDTVPHRFFQSMIRPLTEATGPMAAIILDILDDHIAARGESKEVFPKGRLGHLFDEITREILNESMKGRFQQLMSKELHTMVGGENKR